MYLAVYFTIYLKGLCDFTQYTSQHFHLLTLNYKKLRKIQKLFFICCHIHKEYMESILMSTCCILTAQYLFAFANTK